MSCCRMLGYKALLLASACPRNKKQLLNIRVLGLYFFTSACPPLLPRCCDDLMMLGKFRRRYLKMQAFGISTPIMLSLSNLQQMRHIAGQVLMFLSFKFDKGGAEV